MQSKVAPYAATPDPTYGRQTPTVPEHEDGPRRARSVPTPDPVDLRLIIEEDQASGSYVYKTINRATGEVVQQLPRAEILKLKDQISYVAGGVVRTKA
jgi:flagellar protein FlaG